MGHRIRCNTLFDVTKTGIQHRNKPVDIDYETWISKRNTQCNLDTILQIVSLRSLPELYNEPVFKNITYTNFMNFGRFYLHWNTNEDSVLIPSWTFDFYVQDVSVFYDGINKLGFLYSDCQRVPMIKCNSMYEPVKNFLDVTDELKNIHFEVIGYE